LKKISFISSETLSAGFLDSAKEQTYLPGADGRLRSRRWRKCIVSQVFRLCCALVDRTSDWVGQVQRDRVWLLAVVVEEVLEEVRQEEGAFSLDCHGSHSLLDQGNKQAYWKPAARHSDRKQWFKSVQV